MTLVDTVARELSRLTTDGEVCLVAVSGGPDSVAMLDLLDRSSDLHGRSLVVGHVDHGIDPHSAAVAGAVESMAAARGLRVVISRHALGPGASETRARDVRRRALRAMAREAGATAIVLAHHADDQAETVLLRLLGGSGPAGLAAMAGRRGPWVRPALGVRRAALHDHLREREIASWADPANTDPAHLRSWLRAEIIPRLEGRITNVVDHLGTAQRQARDARVAWEMAPEVIPELDFAAEGGTISVAAPPLRGYRSPLRDALVAAIGRRLGVPLGARRLAAISRLLQSEGASRRIRVARRLEVELAFDRLTFLQAVGSSFQPVRVEGAATVKVGAHRLVFRTGRTEVDAARVAWQTVLASAPYIVRGWQRGDRIRPVGGSGSRAVATMLREARIPPHRRNGWPVVTAEDATIVWVPGICRSESMIPQRGTEGVNADCSVA